MIINPYRFGGGGTDLSSLLTSLISWWSLDETSGTRADSHGSNTLADNNTVTYATGKQSNAAQFTSANSEYLSVSFGHGLGGGARDWSIAFWVYLDSLDQQTFMFTGDGTAASSNDYFIGYNSGVSRYFLNIPSGGSYNRLDANNYGAPSTATWANIVCYYNNGTTELGIIVNDGTANTSTTASPNAKNASFYLGSWFASQYTNGRLDEVAFWSRLLTASEITAIYNGGNGVAYPG